MSDEGGHVSRWEIDDVEVIIRRVKKLVLGNGSFRGGDVEEGHVKAVIHNKAFCHHKEGYHVTHRRT